MTADKILQYFL